MNSSPSDPLNTADPTTCPQCGRWSRLQNAIWANAIASVSLENPRVQGLLCDCPYPVTPEDDG